MLQAFREVRKETLDKLSRATLASMLPPDEFKIKQTLTEATVLAKNFVPLRRAMKVFCREAQVMDTKYEPSRVWPPPLPPMGSIRAEFFSFPSCQNTTDSDQLETIQFNIYLFFFNIGSPNF